MVALATFLLFPAIALDQPIKPIEFMKKGLTMYKSFIKALLVFAVVAFLVRGPLEYMVFDDPEYGFTDQSKKDILFLLYDVLLGPLLLAVTVSTISFLYKDVIGLESDGKAEN
ncbi:MAG: hypothetical protein COB29_16270 [Sulfitobacter sp.]|nr:MAG: hypothetical protein COB29_16270 [Sulfitobacter sp.]